MKTAAACHDLLMRLNNNDFQIKMHGTLDLFGVGEGYN